MWNTPGNSVVATFSMEFPELDEIRDVARVMSEWDKEKISNYRRNLLLDINGRHFPCLFHWPKHIKLCFWKKPMSPTDTFKILCFLLGNRCNVRLAMYWVLSSLAWAPRDELERRCIRVRAFFRDFQSKQSTWFFFSLDKRRIVHLDGSRHQIFQL